MRSAPECVFAQPPECARTSDDDGNNDDDDDDVWHACAYLSGPVCSKRSG